MDASNIERNLYLTTQLIDMNLRVVMALNMYDELQSKGDKLDVEQLGKLLGIPVCPTVSRDGQGIPELFDTVIRVYEGAEESLARHIHINHGAELEKSITRLRDILWRDENLRARYSTRYLAIKYLEGDKEVERMLQGTVIAGELLNVRREEAQRIKALVGTNPESAIVDAKYAFIQGALAETYEKYQEERPKRTLTDRIDAIVTNRWLAFPIFVAILYLVFWTTFTVGQYPMDWIEWLMGRLGDWIGSLMREGWLKDLVVDGVIAGVGSVLVFLPNIMILYLFISLMEDSGYMSRAAFIVDKLMHRIGLHGKSFIPMVMGFGCNVPAIMATRSIESRKSRLITIAIIPFMSCAGRLPIFVLIAGAFFPENPALALLGIYFFGVLLAILSAVVMARFVKDDDLPFVMELPPYRVPTAKATWRHTWEKGKQYLQKMATTILIFSVIIWALGYFPRNKELVAAKAEKETLAEKTPETLETRIDSLSLVQQENSLIGHLGKGIAPALDPLGFDWRMDVGLIAGVGAKELVVSTMGVMYSQSGTAVEEEDEDNTQLQNALKGSVSKAAALAFMIFVLLYFPCIATFTAIKAETGKWSWAVLIAVYTILVAWLFAFAAYRIGLLIW